MAKLPVRSRGRSRAHLVSELADGRAESPGESLSRVRMFELRLLRPELQVEVRDVDGLAGRCDFGWEEQRLLGEFDGRVKYGRLCCDSAEEAAETLWREKRREDRLRRTGALVARWVWADVWDGRWLLGILRQLGLVPTPRRGWL